MPRHEGPVGGLGLAVAALAIAVQADDPVQNTHPAWSPSGDTIAFDSDRSGEFHVYVVRPDGTGLRRITPPGANHSHPAWSPDGTALAFESDRAGDFDIWRIQADGTGLQQLTSGPAIDVVASWSPDGSSIAFGSTIESNTDVAVVDAGGGNLRRITTHAAYDGVPRWAPDGGGIAFDTDRTGKREIWIASPEEHVPPRPLLADEHAVHVAAWAPGGRRISATVAGDSEAGDLVGFDLEDGAATVLAARAGWEGAASWSPSGTELALQHLGPGGWVLEILDLRTRTIRELDVAGSGR